MFRLYLCIFFVCYLGELPGAFARENVLYYPRPEADFDERTGYPLALLRLAFQQSEELKSYSLKPTDIRMPRGRSLKLLEKGIAIDIFWSISTPQRDEGLTKVDFDLYKGMFGYRLLMVNKANKAGFELMNSPAEIKEKVAALGYDWPDYEIFIRNGFNVQGTSSYSGLFTLLERNRVDYLPRSLFEIWSESDFFKNQDFQVVESFAIYYPITFNYYLNREDKDIAALLEDSLNLLYQKGDFDLLFSVVWQDSMERANLDDKRIVHLDN